MNISWCFHFFLSSWALLLCSVCLILPLVFKARCFIKQSGIVSVDRLFQNSKEENPWRNLFCLVGLPWQCSSSVHLSSEMSNNQCNRATQQRDWMLKMINTWMQVHNMCAMFSVAAIMSNICNVFAWWEKIQYLTCSKSGWFCLVQMQRAPLKILHQERKERKVCLCHFGFGFFITIWLFLSTQGYNHT